MRQNHKKMIPETLSIEAFNKQTDWLKTSRAEEYIFFKASLVFTKSVDSNFRAFWLAPVTWNILGCSLFWDKTIKWLLVSHQFRKMKF